MHHTTQDLRKNGLPSLGNHNATEYTEIDIGREPRATSPKIRQRHDREGHDFSRASGRKKTELNPQRKPPAPAAVALGEGRET
jgi:hypothetical protein